MDAVTDPLPSILDALAEAPPRCGLVRVVAIDGPSGSGKTTLAARISTATGAPVAHLDEVFEGWDGLAEAPGQLADWVLRPLSQGRPGSFRRWDWLTSTRAEEVVVELPAGGVLIVEGCGSSVRPAGDFAAVRVWVEAPVEVRFARGIARDGDSYAPHWRRWQAQEDALFTADATRARADLIVTT